MPSLQVQARALGDPTRHAIFEYLTDAGTEVGVAELTEHFGLNHNAIRQHLAKLVDAELVVAGTAPPAGRGRPRLTYRASASADSRWGAIGPYERLSMLLTEIVSTGDSPEDVGRRAGRRLSRGLVADRPVDLIAELMDRQGFAPKVRQAGDHLEVTLQTCPFASAVLTDPDTVCELHLGMARGIADHVGAIVVEDLVTQDPRQANCRLRCTTT